MRSERWTRGTRGQTPRPPRLPSGFQQRDGLYGRRPRQGLKKCVDIRGLLFGDDLGGVGRHFPRRFPDVGNEPRVGNRVGPEPWARRCRALRFAAMTLVAAEL